MGYPYARLSPCWEFPISIPWEYWIGTSGGYGQEARLMYAGIDVCQMMFWTQIVFSLPFCVEEWPEQVAYDFPGALTYRFSQKYSWSRHVVKLVYVVCMKRDVLWIQPNFVQETSPQQTIYLLFWRCERVVTCRAWPEARWSWLMPPKCNGQLLIRDMYF